MEGHLLDERLLAHLRSQLASETLDYAERPARITGGFDTQVYSLRLSGATEGWSRPLILRLFRAGSDPQRARFEATVQNATAAMGYPAPRVFHVCLEADPLGAPFIIMERLPGRIMLDAFFRPAPLFFRLPRILAETQAKLHELDHAAPGLSPLKSPGRPNVEGEIDQMRREIDAAALDGLRPGVQWLESNRPAAAERPVICHGDFHPLNILLDGGKVSGVIDWSSVRVADAAYDVGATIALFTQGPVDLPGILQGPIDIFRRWIVARYRAAYLRLRPIDEQAIDYYEALRCLGFLVEAGEHRQADLGAIERPQKPSAFTAPRERNSIINRFDVLTGVRLSIP